MRTPKSRRTATVWPASRALKQAAEKRLRVVRGNAKCEGWRGVAHGLGPRHLLSDQAQALITDRLPCLSRRQATHLNIRWLFANHCRNTRLDVGRPWRSPNHLVVLSPFLAPLIRVALGVAVDAADATGARAHTLRLRPGTSRCQSSPSTLQFNSAQIGTLIERRQNAEWDEMIPPNCRNDGITQYPCQYWSDRSSSNAFKASPNTMSGCPSRNAWAAEKRAPGSSRSSLFNHPRISPVARANP